MREIGKREKNENGKVKRKHTNIYPVYIYTHPQTEKHMHIQICICTYTRYLLIKSDMFENV